MAAVIHNTRAIKSRCIVRLSSTAKKSHKCPVGRTNNEYAIVRSSHSSGEVYLCDDLHGCDSWHIGDLVEVSVDDVMCKLNG